MDGPDLIFYSEDTTTLEDHLAEARRKQQSYVDRLKHIWKQNNFDQVKLRIGDTVYVKRVVLSEKGAGISKKLSMSYSGPYVVHSAWYENSYLLMDPDTGKILPKPQNIRNLKYSYQCLPSCLTSRE